jgi:hypothetical protein
VLLRGTGNRSFSKLFLGCEPKQINQALKSLDMKRLLFMMVTVNALIISTLSSCNKSDNLPDPPIHVPPTQGPITLSLTTYHWESEGNGVFVSAFAHVIPVNASYSAKVYLVRDGKDTQINQPISFMDGLLWATNTPTDVNIHYRGDSQNVEYLNHVAFLNIKVVIE